MLKLPKIGSPVLEDRENVSFLTETDDTLVTHGIDGKVLLKQNKYKIKCSDSQEQVPEIPIFEFLAESRNTDNQNVKPTMTLTDIT